MEFAVKHRDFILREYEAGKSTREIAAELGTHKTRIIRALKYLRVTPRSHSESVKNAYKTGRMTSPTSGRERTEEERIKISEGRAKNWAELADFEREEIANKARENWFKQPRKKRNEIQKLANEGLRRSSKVGSKLENFLHRQLLKAGYSAFQHKNITENTALEVDLLLPDIRTVIEVDGPSHYSAIWGEEVLTKTIRADHEKNGLLNEAGYTVVRLRVMKKTNSKHIERTTLKRLLGILAEVMLGKVSGTIIVEIQ